MNTNNTYIVCYDGDGGGLCGHLRHRFELFMLGEIANIDIIDHYPYTRMLFKGTITADEILNKENSILIDELIENSKDMEELVSRIHENKKKYILSGRHHYSQLFRNWLKNQSYEHIYSKYIVFASQLKVDTLRKKDAEKFKFVFRY